MGLTALVCHVIRPLAPFSPKWEGVQITLTSLLNQRVPVAYLTGHHVPAMALPFCRPLHCVLMYTIEHHCRAFPVSLNLQCMPHPA